MSFMSSNFFSSTASLNNDGHTQNMGENALGITSLVALAAYAVAIGCCFYELLKAKCCKNNSNDPENPTTNTADTTNTTTQASKESANLIASSQQPTSTH